MSTNYTGVPSLRKMNLHGFLSVSQPCIVSLIAGDSDDRQTDTHTQISKSRLSRWMRLFEGWLQLFESGLSLFPLFRLTLLLLLLITDFRLKPVWFVNGLHLSQRKIHILGDPKLNFLINGIQCNSSRQEIKVIIKTQSYHRLRWV